jgi:molecular chaperone GrpE (heat shock protein)
MKALALNLKNLVCNSRSFTNCGLKNFNKNFNLSVNRAGLYSNYTRAFFSQKEEKKEESSDDEKKEEKNEEKKEDKKEESFSNEKYKELKTLFNDQQQKMEQLKKKFEDLRQAYLNTVEETEQIKKRNDREIANTKEFAISKFAKDILDVHDNFSRAMNSIADKNFKEISELEKVETFNSFLEGI